MGKGQGLERPGDLAPPKAGRQLAQVLAMVRLHGYHIGAGSWYLQSYLVLGRVLAEASGDLGSIPNSVLSSWVIMGKSP